MERIPQVDQIPIQQPVQLNQPQLEQIPQIQPQQTNVIRQIQVPTITSLSEERKFEPPVVRGLEVPVVNIPSPQIDYPVIDVPTQEEFERAVQSERKEEENTQEKKRELPETKLPPNLNQIIQQTQPLLPQQNQPVVSVPPKQDTELQANTINILGTQVTLPEASVVVTAGAVAVVTTAVTVASTAAFNAIKNAAEPLVKQLQKDKFKIKIRITKPVLHYVTASDGFIDIFEYSSTGTRLVAKVENIEQYIRDQIDTNSLYEIDNNIIIDESLKDKFTKEGQQRFKTYFAAPIKIAKKLSARIAI